MLPEVESKKSTNRLSSAPSNTLYPKECNICLTFRVQHKNKKFEPYKVLTTDAERTIKAAAKEKNEQLYAEINHLDLIAKEFKVHQHCYQSFTRGYSAGSKKPNPQPVYEKGDFEAVKACILNDIISMYKAISMKTLHNLYGISTDDSRYRNKLKERIKSHFGDKLLFLSPSSGKGEVVIELTKWKKFFR